MQPGHHDEALRVRRRRPRARAARPARARATRATRGSGSPRSTRQRRQVHRVVRRGRRPRARSRGWPGRFASFAALYSVIAPNMLPWSVTATACIPAAGDALDQVLHLHRPVEQRVLRVDVEMDELGRHRALRGQWVPALRAGCKAGGGGTDPGPFHRTPRSPAPWALALHFHPTLPGPMGASTSPSPHPPGPPPRKPAALSVPSIGAGGA